MPRPMPNHLPRRRKLLPGVVVVPQRSLLTPLPGGLPRHSLPGGLPWAHFPAPVPAPLPLARPLTPPSIGHSLADRAASPGQTGRHSFTPSGTRPSRCVRRGRRPVAAAFCRQTGLRLGPAGVGPHAVCPCASRPNSRFRVGAPADIEQFCPDPTCNGRHALIDWRRFDRRYVSRIYRHPCRETPDL